ncbi:hypothetical protein [Acidovorax sp. 100]|uniref:hypothetical protein n=1 Tax=Acidovorax sp. 100 TaxID=2135635 RepID=UPI0011C38C28|nr:hypothetical protein [Acidovorax sp. 100]
MANDTLKFPGYQKPLDPERLRRIADVPLRVYSIDGKTFVQVDLDSMSVPSDEVGSVGMDFRKSFACFSQETRLALTASLLDALDGKRKSSTVRRWLGELSLFGRTISSELSGRRISTITQKMYVWYTSQKQASQIKLLRSALLHMIDIDAPGLENELVDHLKHVAPPKPRSTIEIQNSEPTERPFSMREVQSMLSVLSQLYLSGKFDPQTHLAWRLLISEAMRPSQMRLLKFGDFKLVRDEQGRLQSVLVNVPMVKQAGTSARDYTTAHRLSSALAVAIGDHFDFVSSILGNPPPSDWSLFSVRKGYGSAYELEAKSLNVSNLIKSSRKDLADQMSRGYSPDDFFARRFKHTKLTHLSQKGASKEMLAYAGFQTSTISLGHYVNLTDEAFELYEEQLESAHTLIADAFSGKIVSKDQSTYRDVEHEISDLRLDAPVGACGREPCEALACLACYGCPRFEAFDDGPHRQVEALLVEEQTRARTAGLNESAVNLRSNILVAVRTVIKLIDEKAKNAADKNSACASKN